jgi:Uma2 family endonuclease
MQNKPLENLLHEVSALSPQDFQRFLFGLEKVKREKTEETPARRFTPEEYETVSERVEIKVEYLEGQIVPKEGIDPLPAWVVDEILSPNFSLSDLNFEFPMHTIPLTIITANLHRLLDRALDEDLFRVFSQDPEIFISLSGSYRIPDVSVTPTVKDWVLEQNKLTNPLVVIEVLSPSNKGEEFTKKLRDYQSIPSLQEYWLVSQDQCYIERYVRKDEKIWEYVSYNREDEEIEFPALGVTLKTEKVYNDVVFKEDA